MPAHLLQTPDRSLPIPTADLAAPRIAAILNGWGRRKNAEKGMEAFALLQEQLPGATLHLYGYDFGPGEQAEKLAVTQGWAEGMHFHGLTPHAQLLEQLASMHVLLHPALEEACPMALVEAMAAGVVVVGGSKSGGVPWVLDDGKAGALADVTSVQDMVRVMLDLVSDPERHATLVGAGQLRARLVFDPHTVAKSYEQAYALAQQRWSSLA